MASSFSFASLPMVLLLLLLLHGQSSSAYVEQTCSDASKSDRRVNYDFCVNRLYKSPWSTEADTWRLAQIAAELGLNTTEVGKSKMDERVPSERDAAVKALLEACSTNYDDMGTALAKADDGIRARDYGLAKGLLTQAIRMGSQCGSSFSKAGKAAPAVVAQLDSEGVNLSILCYAITNLLK
ncbi:pectinesterase inhibitor 8-like [Zingiber officinale]|uniref:pectinesterase inhibitor 8-like n=1 Tax=Zingiber officinale TaxID=94328 RepID=UPI001C4C8CF5|nr:pectinesterase inhibitor 8-like [Zingiber officinale]